MLIGEIRQKLSELRLTADQQQELVNSLEYSEQSDTAKISAYIGNAAGKLGVAQGLTDNHKVQMERKFQLVHDKLQELDKWLPRLKGHIREFFTLSNSVKSVFLQIDDFYHLKRSDQPLVMDYIHRLCKDVPLYFKVASLRHATTLYADRDGQPIGAQERHDYQPINIDYTFKDFRKTREYNRKILQEFGKLAGLKPGEIDDLFKGEGLDRLIMAGRSTARLFVVIFGNSGEHSRRAYRQGRH